MINVRLITCKDPENPSLRGLVEEAGHRVVTLDRLSTGAMSETFCAKADVIVLEAAIGFKSRKEGGSTKIFDCLSKLFDGLCAPMVLIAPECDIGKSVIEAVKSSGLLFACLSEPVRAMDLKLAVELAYMRFKELAALKEETSSLKGKMAERALIERAKGLLMEVNRMPEQEAFERMRKTSMDTRRPLHDVAAMIVQTLKRPV